jgi:hypothetical protein
MNPWEEYSSEQATPDASMPWDEYSQPQTPPAKSLKGDLGGSAKAAAGDLVQAADMILGIPGLAAKVGVAQWNDVLNLLKNEPNPIKKANEVADKFANSGLGKALTNPLETILSTFGAETNKDGLMKEVFGALGDKIEQGTNKVGEVTGSNELGQLAKQAVDVGMLGLAGAGIREGVKAPIKESGITSSDLLKQFEEAKKPMEETAPIEQPTAPVEEPIAPPVEEAPPSTPVADEPVTPEQMSQAFDNIQSDTANNASGESPASAEAISRLQSQNDAGVKMYEVNVDTGETTPLVTVDRVDQKPAKGNAIIQVAADGTKTIVENNSKYGNTPALNRVDYLAKIPKAEEPSGFPQAGVGGKQGGAIGFKPEPPSLEQKATTLSKEDWQKDFFKTHPEYDGNKEAADFVYNKLNPAGIDSTNLKAKVNETKKLFSEKVRIGMVKTKLTNEQSCKGRIYSRALKVIRSNEKVFMMLLTLVLITPILL